MAGFKLFCFGVWFNRYCFTVTQTTFELYNARNFCKQSVIFTHTNIQTRMHRSATLTNDDITWDNAAATRFFNA